MHEGTLDYVLVKHAWMPYIAIIGKPLEPQDHQIVIEKNIVIKDIDVFEDALHRADLYFQFEIPRPTYISVHTEGSAAI